jgi:hypothetical protein
MLDGHLQNLPLEQVVPYSDKVFREAAVEWVIATDQVCGIADLVRNFHF